MNVRSGWAIALSSLRPGAANARQTTPLPEPGLIELLAIGAVAGIAVTVRNRHK
jgi:hypothetical protein